MVANFERTVNDPTLMCNVTDVDGNQVLTIWRVANFEGVPSPRQLTRMDTLFFIDGHPIPNAGGITYQNQITIVNWTSALDGVSLTCGSGGQDTEQIGVVLRIYSEHFRSKNSNELCDDRLIYFLKDLPICETTLW